MSTRRRPGLCIEWSFTKSRSVGLWDRQVSVAELAGSNHRTIIGLPYTRPPRSPPLTRPDTLEIGLIIFHKSGLMSIGKGVGLDLEPAHFSWGLVGVSIFTNQEPGGTGSGTGAIWPGFTYFMNQEPDGTGGGTGHIEWRKMIFPLTIIYYYITSGNADDVAARPFLLEF